MATARGRSAARDSSPISRGGALAELARERRGLHVPLPRRVTCHAPRSARWSHRSWSCCSGMGLAPERARAARTRAGAARAAGATQCQPEVEGAANPARELARKIGRTIPLVYGGGALGAVAAYRWKCDVNENAKAPAYWHAYPELDHNEICGVGPARRRDPPALHARRAAPRLRARAARRRASTITREIIEEAVHQVLAVEAEGEGRLAQLLDLDVPRRLGVAATSRSTTTSIPARSMPSSS